MEKLALCTRYDRLGASSRLRFYACRQALSEAGYDVNILPFFTGEYLRRLYDTGHKSRFRWAESMLKRLKNAPFLPERLIIEYELLPQIPYCFEKLFLKNRRYILNFDDNVWEKYRNNPILQNKYDRLAESAAGIIAANDFLCEELQKLNKNIIKIPTVPDIAQYRKKTEKRRNFTLCWIGTPVTYYEYFCKFKDIWRETADTLGVHFLIIAGKNITPLPGVPAEYLDWSEKTEAELISSCHAGVMPLTDDAFARGKSGYKLLQYFAAGLPVIASPVGENCRIVTPQCGYLASTAPEWLNAVSGLQNADICRTLSAGALLRSQEFSLQKYATVFTGFVRQTFSG